MGAVNTAFWESVFSLCRAPLTTNLLTIFTTWQHYEGGNALNNPLNTERVMTGSRPYNTAGVQDYATETSGASATAMTLLNGRYPAVLAAMRANTPIDSWSVEPIPTEIDTWGTNGFATYLRTLTPQEDDMNAQQAQQLQEVWEAIYAAAPPDGPALWNALEIIRRQNTVLGAPYLMNPGPVPAQGHEPAGVAAAPPPAPPTAISEQA